MQISCLDNGCRPVHIVGFLIRSAPQACIDSSSTNHSKLGTDLQIFSVMKYKKKNDNKKPQKQN